MADAFIIDACRTPRGIGKQGKGALAHLHPQHVAATVLRALVERNGFDTADVDDIIWGTSSQVCEQSGDLGRMAALDAGYDVRASGVTLDRFCGSGITANNFAAAMVMAGHEDLVIGGGTEMMSLPKKGLLPMGAGNAHLQEIHPQSHQGVCADAIASTRGHRPTDARRARGRVAAARRGRDQGRPLRPQPRARATTSTAPSPSTTRSSPVRGTTAESLAALRAQLPRGRRPPLRRRRAHLPRADQPALPRPRDHARPPRRQLLGRRRRRRRRALRERGLRARRTASTPRARIVASGNMGDDPTLMLNAPVPSARKILKRAGMTLDDIDLFEINEAFAVVSEKFMRDLDLDRDKVNVNGGAMALGHPIGATGAILIGTVLDELERRDKQRRSRHDVRRRRHGARHHHRARLTTPARWSRLR